jgi:hypothetical protein
MNIDERLESLAKTVERIAETHGTQLTRLGERVDALAQSVELIGQMQAKTEKEIRLLGRYVRTIVL